ncbi:MAG: hypothetical protein WCK66_02900 [Betaproteobacteria bacterium]
MTSTNNPKIPGACGCGRSPTGQCMGWHALSDEEFAKAKQQWQIQEEIKNMFGVPSSAGGSGTGNPKGS